LSWLESRRRRGSAAWRTAIAHSDVLPDADVPWVRRRPAARGHRIDECASTGGPVRRFVGDIGGTIAPMAKNAWKILSFRVSSSTST
jgi:hypothetical protein